MSKRSVGAGLLLCCISAVANAKDTRFWNLTANTITAFQLSAAGRNEWGADQAANDSDHAVEHDERLKITGIKSGLYDAKFADKTGRTCVIRNITIQEGAIFSIDEKTAQACGR
jgi:hypothetical protein